MAEARGWNLYRREAKRGMIKPMPLLPVASFIAWGINQQHKQHMVKHKQHMIKPMPLLPAASFIA